MILENKIHWNSYEALDKCCTQRDRLLRNKEQFPDKGVRKILDNHRVQSIPCRLREVQASLAKESWHENYYPVSRKRQLVYLLREWVFQKKKLIILLPEFCSSSNFLLFWLEYVKFEIIE